MISAFLPQFYPIALHEVKMGLVIRLCSSLLTPLSTYFGQTEIHYRGTAILDFMLVYTVLADLGENF